MVGKAAGPIPRHCQPIPVSRSVPLYTAIIRSRPSLLRLPTPRFLSPLSERTHLRSADLPRPYAPSPTTSPIRTDIPPSGPVLAADGGGGEGGEGLAMWGRRRPRAATAARGPPAAGAARAAPPAAASLRRQGGCPAVPPLPLPCPTYSTSGASLPTVPPNTPLPPCGGRWPFEALMTTTRPAMAAEAPRRRTLCWGPEALFPSGHRPPMICAVDWQAI